MKCPDCKGECGEYEAVLYKGAGGGPWNMCDFCEGNGTVSFFQWLSWKCSVLFENIRKR